MSQPSSKSKSKVVYGTDDRLFGRIEKVQQSQSKPFGKFLDAGTGTHSLRWMASLILDREDKEEGEKGDKSSPSPPILKIDHYTAITADETMRSNVFKEAQSLGIQDKGDIIIGNWQNRNTNVHTNNAEELELCQGEMYDTILADYLVGAMDGFSPYYQDQIFPRLAKHLKPGGLLHVVGLNPIPDSADGDANIIVKVTKLRDACILLAGHRCYREYPMDWIERQLENVDIGTGAGTGTGAGLEVVYSSKFPILYSHAAIVRQLNVARSKLPLFQSKALAREMGEAIDALEEESRVATERSSTGRLRLGFDYVVTAKMKESRGGEKEVEVNEDVEVEVNEDVEVDADVEVDVDKLVDGGGKNEL